MNSNNVFSNVVTLFVLMVRHLLWKNLYFSSGPTLKEGSARILPTTQSDDDYVIIVGLGKDENKGEESERENRDLNREKVRTAISAGVRSLQSNALFRRSIHF